MPKAKKADYVVVNLEELTKDTNKQIAELVEALEAFDEVKIEKVESEFGGYEYEVTVSVEGDELKEGFLRFTLSKQHGLLQEALRLAVNAGCDIIATANA